MFSKQGSRNNKTGESMNQTTIAKATNAASGPAGILSSFWLWVSGHDAAWWIAILTAMLLASQLYWGWARWFREEV
jgi:hypothetical protein